MKLIKAMIIGYKMLKLWIGLIIIVIGNKWRHVAKMINVQVWHDVKSCCLQFVIAT